MTDIAAHVVDHIVPAVPVRQFVLSLPHWLRYRLAYDHDHCIAVLAIFVRSLLGFYRNRAKNGGVHNGRTGSVTFIQRFGSAANLNVHLHVLAMDGVFSEQPNGELAFHPAPPPTTPEVSQLLTTARKRLLRHLGKHGLLNDDHGDVDRLSDEAPLLANCYAASIHLGLPTEPPRPAKARASPLSKAYFDCVA